MVAAVIPGRTPNGLWILGEQLPLARWVPQISLLLSNERRPRCASRGSRSVPLDPARIRPLKTAKTRQVSDLIFSKFLLVVALIPNILGTSNSKFWPMPSFLDIYRKGDYRNLIKSECFLKRYDRIFAEIHTDAPVIVELGVDKGASLRLWRETFPAAMIIGFDAHLPVSGVPPNCTLVQGSQQKRADLERILAHADPIDIVIDDCSHVAAPTRLAFDTLFPHVRPGGFYAIEDWGTGYWPNWPDGALPQNNNHLAGMVGLVKEFIDVVGIPAKNRLRKPPPIYKANWSTMNSPYEYVIFYPGIVCVKKAVEPGEPMHSPLARKEPSTGRRMIDY